MKNINWEIFYNPGNVLCDYLKIKDDHKFILRVFVNLTYYGHFIAGICLYLVRNTNLL